MWTRHVAVAAAPRGSPARRCRRRRGPAERGVGRDRHDDVDERPPAGLAHAHAAHLGPRLGRRRSPRARASAAPGGLAVHQHLHVLAHQADGRRRRRAPRRPARRSRRASAYPARTSSRPIRTASVPAKSEAKCTRVGGQRGAAQPPRRAGETTARLMSTTSTIAITTNAHQVGVDVVVRAPGQARDRLERDDGADDDEERRPRRAPRGARPCRGRRGGRGRPAGSATRSAKNVSSAATRSVPGVRGLGEEARASRSQARDELQRDQARRGDDREQRRRAAARAVRSAAAPSRPLSCVASHAEQRPRGAAAMADRVLLGGRRARPSCGRCDRRRARTPGRSRSRRCRAARPSASRCSGPRRRCSSPPAGSTSAMHADVAQRGCRRAPRASSCSRFSASVASEAGAARRAHAGRAAERRGPRSPSRRRSPARRSPRRPRAPCPARSRRTSRPSRAAARRRRAAATSSCGISSSDELAQPCARCGSRGRASRRPSASAALLRGAQPVDPRRGQREQLVEMRARAAACPRRSPGPRAARRRPS